MKLLLRLGWRNLWRNKRRSILTLMAITFAAFASVAMRGFQQGTYEVNIRTAVEMFSGYLQVQHPDFMDKQTLRNTFRMNDEVRNAITTSEDVVSYAPRIQADGLISYRDKSFGSAIFGIDPQKERETTDILKKTNAGSFFDSDSGDKIVVGYKLLDNLNANIGDTIVVLSQGYYGSLGNLKFVITGSTKMGAYEFDAMTAFIPIKTAQELLSMPGRISAAAIRLNDIDNIDNARKEISAKLAGTEQAPVVLPWDVVMPEFKQSIELDNISGILFLFILILIVAFGILNTVLMSVTERFREFGVQLAVGMPNKNLVSLVLIEVFFLTLLGVVLGDILGWGLNYYFIHNPITFTGEFAEMYKQYGFLPVMKSSADPFIFINTSLSVLVIAVVASVYPAYKVYKLEPLKGIRYT